MSKETAANFVSLFKQEKLFLYFSDFSLYLILNFFFTLTYYEIHSD